MILTQFLPLLQIPLYTNLYIQLLLHNLTQHNPLSFHSTLSFPSSQTQCYGSSPPIKLTDILDLLFAPWTEWSNDEKYPFIMPIFLHVCTEITLSNILQIPDSYFSFLPEQFVCKLIKSFVEWWAKLVE